VEKGRRNKRETSVPELLLLIFHHTRKASKGKDRPRSREKALNDSKSQIQEGKRWKDRDLLNYHRTCP